MLWVLLLASVGGGTWDVVGVVWVFCCARMVECGLCFFGGGGFGAALVGSAVWVVCSLWRSSGDGSWYLILICWRNVWNSWDMIWGGSVQWQSCCSVDFMMFASRAF